MKPAEILSAQAGKSYFILGNEAIVRGALEGGLRFSATYPGTPSSEIGDILYAISEKAGIYFEFSTNEKVALEVATSGGVCGLRSMTFMKHVGLNVASDPFMTAVYSGTTGGFAIIVADDPSMHSSQNEQDTRHFSEISRCPMLEPADPNEAYDMMKEVFELSENLELPVIVRTTTRVAHIRSSVKFGEIKNKQKEGTFQKNPAKWVPVPANSYKMHKLLLEKVKKAQEFSENSEFNYIIDRGNSGKGIITSGCAFNYCMDVINSLKAEVKILKLGMTAPLPERKIAEFLRNCREVMIVEELDPYLESAVRVIAQKENIPVTIFGKIEGPFTKLYEYNTDRVAQALAPFFGVSADKEKTDIPELNLPVRPPVLCAGCSHRAAYYSVNEALRKAGIKDVPFLSDIGCYTLGIAPPASTADYILCMGSSAGTGCGFSKALGKKTVSFIGDSTFFHSGLAGLINAYHNNHNFLFVILDNSTTAMTGHQPHPGLGGKLGGIETKSVDIETVVKSIGIEFVETVDAYNTKKSIEIFTSAMAHNGLAVVIAKRPCALAFSRTDTERFTFKVNADKCTGCFICLKKYACPAFEKEDKKVKINSALCFGCSVCSQICPSKAIEVNK